MDKAAKENKGAMAAVMKLSPEKVEEICAKFEKAWPVNYNSPAQIVVAASEEDIDPLCDEVKAQKGRAKKLAVSGAFHSPFMHDAAVGLAEYMENIEFAEPKVPVYANVTAQPYEGEYKKLTAAQVESPVKWISIVENMIANGVDTFIEVGVGKTLSGLIGKINPDVKVYKVENKADLDNLAI